MTCLCCLLKLRESEDFYSLTKDSLLELILSDELEIEDEQVIGFYDDFVFLSTNQYYSNYLSGYQLNVVVCFRCRLLTLTLGCTLTCGRLCLTL